ncbi:hypothetical protein [Streptomyces sp. NPDC092952]
MRLPEARRRTASVVGATGGRPKVPGPDEPAGPVSVQGTSLFAIGTDYAA